MTTSRTDFYRGWRARMRGFTMVELLVVIVIMSVLLSIIVPSMGSTDVARVRTATRGVMQVSRYARSMAVLRQETLYLEIYSDGKLRVSGGKDGGGGASAASSSPSSASERADGSDASIPEKDGSGGAVTQMSDVNTEKEYKQVRFQVELDEDELSDMERENETELERVEVERKEEDGEKEHVETSGEMVKIPYESNGRCLPYRVTITPAPQPGDEDSEEGVADRAVLIVDRFGNVKVEGEEK